MPVLPTWRRPTRLIQPQDPYFNNVSLLLHMNGSDNSTTFTDSSASGLAVTANGNAKISTAQSKWNGSSGYLDGSSSFLSIPSTPALGFGTGDFTVEGWFYINSFQSYRPIFANQFLFYFGSEGQVLLYNGSSDVVATANGVIPLNTWKHVAWCRASNVATIYVDGSSAATATVSTSIDTGVVNYVGKWNSVYYSGYINDLRVSKGLARTIEKPISPFPDA